MQWATPEERRKLGQTRRKQIGRQQHDELNTKARTATALELLERVGARPRSRPAEIEASADGGVALRLLSRRSAGDGRRSLRAAQHQHSVATVRRRACAQPGRIRRAGRTPRLRHQRFRRDHPRAVRVGPEAHGGFAGARGARVRSQGIRRAGRGGALRSALQRADAHVCQNPDSRGGPLPGASARVGRAGA